MATQQLTPSRRSSRQLTGGDAAGAVARAGWAAKSVLYAVTAVLALQVATGNRSEEADQQGALRSVAEQPFGKVLLAVLAIGLVLYGLSRLAEAAGVVRPPGEAKAHERAGYAVSGLLYLGLAALASSLVLGGGGGAAAGGNGEPSGFTAEVMAVPWGRVLVGVVGLTIVAAGLAFVKQAVTKDFLAELRTGDMSRDARRWVGRLGVAGLAARGVVFGLIGWFLISAALSFDPNEAKGLDAALRDLAGRAHGPFLLSLVALGLLAYAAYSMAQARWRDV